VAQILPTAATSARSASGQFTVLAGTPEFPLRPAPALSTNADWIQIEPTFLAISAERVKQAVWSDLGETGPWRQEVLFALRRARTADDGVTIVASRGARGWSYRVELPNQLSVERYLRTLVQVVLLELANRNADEHSAEIPVWLVEGISAQLLANQRTALVLTPPRLNANGVNFSSIMTDSRQLNPLEKAHKTLLGTTPLTFEQLSWPAPGELDGPGAAAYRASAQLFTYELLDFRDGPACLRGFLAALPGYLNWQLAFLSGFKPHFSRPLDIEKWWALQAGAFAGRDLIQTWPYEESWQKLDAALSQTVDVYARTNELPVHSAVPLEMVIRDWDATEQGDVLRDKLIELASLRMRIAPELAGLTAEYEQTLDRYLKEREPGRETVGRGKFNPRSAGYALKLARQNALNRLLLLEAQRERMRPATKQTPATASIP